MNQEVQPRKPSLGERYLNFTTRDERLKLTAAALASAGLIAAAFSPVEISWPGNDTCTEYEFPRNSGEPTATTSDPIIVTPSELPATLPNGAPVVIAHRQKDC